MTDDIKLEQLDNNDFDEIYNLTNINEMMANIADGKTWDRYKVERFIKYNRKSVKSYKITKNKILIGLVFIKDSDNNITIMIDPEYQSKGIGTMVINKLIEKLEENNIKYFFVKIKQTNKKSINLFKKFNTIKINTEKIRNEYYNVYIFIINRPEIKEQKLNINNNDFIYYKDTIEEKDIIYLFNELKKYSIKKMEIDNLKIKNNMLRYENEYLVLKKNYYLEYYLNKITDYFSEDCRVKCKFLENNSPIEAYNKNKSKIMKYMKDNFGYINNFTIYEYFYSDNIKLCSNFDVTLALSIYKIFKPENMLDFSAGWGDRLIGAIAYDKCKYTGVDPSECMEKNYKNIINTLADDKNKYKVIKSPFEKLELNDKFDFIFTSPPFFKLEIYENTDTQSSHYNDVGMWENEFLFPAIRKCHDYLEDDKYLVLYITNYRDYKYVDNLKKYISDNKLFKYSGNIYFYNEITDAIRTIYVWKKIRNISRTNEDNTYIIDTMDDYDVSVLYTNLKQRGWRKFDKQIDKNPTLMFVNTLDKKKRDFYYKLKPYIEFSTFGHNKISFKNNLFETLYNLENTDINKFNKIKDFLPIQYNLDLYKYYKEESYLDKYKNLYVNNKIWIIKPVSGFKGKDIHVFKNRDEFTDFCDKIVNIYKLKWEQNKHLFSIERLSAKGQLNNEWVLQEYITNPFLVPLNNIVKENNNFLIKNKPITKETKLYKFHFRGNVLYFIKDEDIKIYLYKHFGAYLAKREYPQGKDKLYNVDDIHNTHFAGNKYHNIHLFFKESFKEVIPKDKIDEIYNNMIILIKVILSTVNLSCYNSKNCFDFFGIDILLTDDFKIKLLEFNANMSLTNVGDVLMNGLTNLYIDDIFNKKKQDNNFIEINTQSKEITKKLNRQQKEYTYIIDSVFFEDESDINFFKNILEKRGFREFNDKIDKEPTLLFVETPDKKKREYYWKFKPYIEFKVKGHDNIIYKNNLFKTLNNLKNTNNKIFKKIEDMLPEQYNIDLYKYYHDKTYLDKFRNMISKKNVWIFKPVSGWKGKDVIVFDNEKDFVKYCDNIVNNRKDIWRKNKHLFINSKLSTKMKLNNEWVLQKYIKGLYIPIDNTIKEDEYNIIQNINKDDKLHKFHLRVNLLYFIKNNIKYGYFLKKMVSNIGKKPITETNYSDIDAHNTHYQSDLVVLVFPDSYKKIIRKEDIDNIYKQIIDLFNALLYTLDTKCYNAQHCFHVYGIDILITPEYKIKLIEVNGDPGMNPKMFSTQQLINGIANLYIDNILEIKEKQEDDNFIKLELSK